MKCDVLGEKNKIVVGSAHLEPPLNQRSCQLKHGVSYAMLQSKHLLQRSSRLIVGHTAKEPVEV